MTRQQDNTLVRMADTLRQIYVRGPSVSGGEAALGVVGRLNEDHTFSYA